ncbi:MAG: hypothetical protein HOV87_31285 [Catenulispora sp.]|nr:hypothetical protein [Catenulispora sp.]
MPQIAVVPYQSRRSVPPVVAEAPNGYIGRHRRPGGVLFGLADAEGSPFLTLFATAVTWEGSR